MKFSVLMKILPAVVIAIYAVKNMPLKSSNATAGKAKVPLPVELKGTVQKVMQDKDFSYILISAQDEKTWIATKVDPPQVGSEITCIPKTCVEAYESKQLTMAFEKIFVAENISRV